MTLTNFKRRLRTVVLMFFLGMYGASFFLLGRVSLKSINNSQEVNIQGANTKAIENDSFDKPQPYADIQSGDVVPSYVKMCSNTYHGFEIVYPKDWFTTYNDEDEKCLLFASYSFVIPSNLEDNLVPITIEVVSLGDWESTLSYFEKPNEFQNILSVKNIEIAGKSSIKVEATSTAYEGRMHGLVRESYLIFDNKIPLVITYSQLDPNEDVNSFRGILDQMANSLKYI